MQTELSYACEPATSRLLSDALGRLSGHAHDLGTFKLAYLGETGQLVSRSNGTVATAWTYDTNLHDRKLIAIANKPAASAYRFPNNAPEGDIQSIVDSFNGHTWTLGYDAADRLRTAASLLGPADGYTPDPADDLVRISRPTGSVDVPPNALNQAVRANHSPYSYDADGQLVADASRTCAGRSLRPGGGVPPLVVPPPAKEDDDQRE